MSIDPANVDSTVVFCVDPDLGVRANIGIGTYFPDAPLSVNVKMSVGGGDATNPSIAHMGDLTTGIYFPANGVIAFTAGGVETFRVGVTISDAGSNVVSQVLTDGATINWNAANGRIATVTLGGTGRTMAAPTNLRIGTYILNVIQDGSGSRTITTWNSVFKWPSGIAPTLTTTAGARDVMSFFCDGSNLYGTYINDVK